MVDNSYYVIIDNSAIPENIEELFNELGYVQNQNYFGLPLTDSESAILFTTSINKSFTICRITSCFMDANPHIGWCHTREKCQTIEELLNNIKQ